MNEFSTLSLRVGSRVQVTALADETADRHNLHKTGTVTSLNAGLFRDIGASDTDPFISVSFDGGGGDHFWTEELTVIPTAGNHEAPGL